MAPRIEVWLDPQSILTGAGESTPVGSLLLGSWDERVKKIFRGQEPYRSALSRKGSRNDHGESILLNDLRFEIMTERVKRMMEKVGIFE